MCDFSCSFAYTQIVLNLNTGSTGPHSLCNQYLANLDCAYIADGSRILHRFSVKVGTDDLVVEWFGDAGGELNGVKHDVTSIWVLVELKLAKNID